jgi:hypothetical protein
MNNNSQSSVKRKVMGGMRGVGRREQNEWSEAIIGGGKGLGEAKVVDEAEVVGEAKGVGRWVKKLKWHNANRLTVGRKSVRVVEEWRSGYRYCAAV